jgi:hypothetical protein
LYPFRHTSSSPHTAYHPIHPGHPTQQFAPLPRNPPSGSLKQKTETQTSSKKQKRKPPVTAPYKVAGRKSVTEDELIATRPSHIRGSVPFNRLLEKRKTKERVVLEPSELDHLERIKKSLPKPRRPGQFGYVPPPPSVIAVKGMSKGNPISLDSDDEVGDVMVVQATGERSVEEYEEIEEMEILRLSSWLRQQLQKQLSTLK